MPLKSGKTHALLATLALCLGVVLGAGNALAGSPVFVSILPQKYFVEKIAGDLAEVSVLVMPGASPHTYEPTPRQMTALAGAKAYFSIGVNFEEVWLPRINSANPTMRIVATDRGIEKIPMAAHAHHAEDGGHDEDGGHEDHAHDTAGAAQKDHEHDQAAAHHDHDHDHGTLDPHVWLSPDGARVLARNTCAGLIKMDPANEAVYRANADALLLEIDRVDAEIRTRLDTLPENRRSFMVFHPSWGYFAHQYGLTQIPIESQGKEPSPKGLSQIIKQGRDLGIRVIFVQPQFSEKSAAVIAAEIGAKTAELDPLAEDWAATMLHAAQAISQAAR
ncbi:MAG: zinc ABC transporter substrate-binding protein [Pseudodesulfovibrio sp.]|uniref:Periplasmic solute binding protein n=1 Tax=Pseudodesulfovibrio aespoeensis (strain ATCC 700646 / DSM 10631 / Aspo-2) TaxID=643562 RepID=E6VSP7_PSEA9|nr:MULTISPECIES: zinc ABC transporter substrate-binding protein [Pseudodesulfovibrio]MBU4193056.1 zinc ABC transporter substrate-binding protein [Pseudomonadota bacterium]ADU62032.1 periplasmic solute binding protein [Pseudodesulfovibrio aespoeensis Aspo-2]MBU4244677.1 zinc ABC transporter substrate-binding protein [Pseudomonadota bacterium]MBU4474675.1 zinc ABC transporter substrate-binding protein [Pseudomonadota bacterium]MBU4515998.1 zinc ABC transporter substrate-binding protein [Pseudomo